MDQYQVHIPMAAGAVQVVPEQQRSPPRSVKGIFLAKDAGVTKNGTAIETIAVEADNTSEIIIATSFKTILIDVS